MLTLLMTVKAFSSIGEKQGMDNLVYFTDAKFNASLKGIIDIQGRMTEAFSLVIAMESRNPAFDKDYTKYSN